MDRITLILLLSASLVACSKDVDNPDAGTGGAAPAVDGAVDAAPDPSDGAVDVATPPVPDDAAMESDGSPAVLSDAEPSVDLDAMPATEDGGTPAGDGTVSVDGAPSESDGAPGESDGAPGADDGAIADLAVDRGPPPEPLPPGECVGIAPDPNAAPPEPIPEDTCMNCVDAPTPTWRLEDFQPLSCGLGMTYGVDTFAGAPTLVALFNAGCGYCQGQCAKLEEMRIEFGLTNVEANLLAVNSASNLIYQDRLAARCSIPLFQDTEEDLAMESMDGSVFDMFVYRPDGTLHVYLSGRGDIETTLSDEEGYENVKAAILSAASGEPYEPPFPPMAEPDGGIPIFPPIPEMDAGAE